MDELPVIKIELSRMKYTILHAFAAYQETITKNVEERLSQLVENFPYEQVVEELATEALKEAIKAAVYNYFRFGEGHEAINEAIKEILKKEG